MSEKGVRPTRRIIVAFIVVIAIVLTGFFVLGNAGLPRSLQKINDYDYTYNFEDIHKYRPYCNNLGDYNPQEVLTYQVNIDTWDDRDITVYEYWYYWEYQNDTSTIPWVNSSHPYDYEPIFVFVENDEIFLVSFDKWHYEIGREESPTLVNDTHVLFEFIGDYRAIKMVYNKTYNAGLNYFPIELNNSVKDHLVDRGFKRVFVEQPDLIMLKTWFTRQYIYQQTYDRIEKYNGDYIDRGNWEWY